MSFLGKAVWWAAVDRPLRGKSALAALVDGCKPDPPFIRTMKQAWEDLGAGAELVNALLPEPQPKGAE